MDPKISPIQFLKKKKNHDDAKALFYPYIFLDCITVKGVYVRMNSLLKRSFAGNSARFSFLSVSLYGTRKKIKNKKNSQAFAKVRFSYSFSLWFNENNQCKLSFEHLKLKDLVF